MKAVQFVQVHKSLEIADVPKPVAGPGELVFKVKACGICASDLHAAEVPEFPAGIVFGHEYSGEIAEVGAGVQGWKPGDRMIALPIKPCGACEQCKAGNLAGCTQIIIQGFDLKAPGAYAEYSSCPAPLAIRIPDGLSDTHAAAVEPLAVGLGAWHSGKVEDGTCVMVIGSGIIGLSVAKWARFFGAAAVGIVELVPARLERARKVGVEVVIDGNKCTDPVAEFEKQTGQKPTVIFECTGRPLLANIIGFAPIGCHVVMVGTGMQPEGFTVLSAAMKRLRVTFHLGYEPHHFGFVMQMLANGRMTLDYLLTGTVNLDDTPAMFDLLSKPNDHCKVIITP